MNIDKSDSSLVIQVRLRSLVLWLVSIVGALIFTIWIFWAIALNNEITRIKKDIYAAVTQSVADAMINSFTKNYMSLAQYDNCRAELEGCYRVNTDLARALGKKELRNEKSRKEKGKAKKGSTKVVRNHGAL